MELWDAYDMNLNKIKDKTLIRGEAVPDGMYHLVCEVIVKHTDGTYLLMQRDKNKHYGEYWEATAGGSALQGENPLECAIRELREKTGINETNLVELGRVVQHNHHSIYVDYIVITDWDKSNITLHQGEKQDYNWVDNDTLKNMYSIELVTRRMQLFIKELR